MKCMQVYRVSQKSTTPNKKAINNILDYVKFFWAKCCPVIGNLYPHVYQIWKVYVKTEWIGGPFSRLPSFSLSQILRIAIGLSDFERSQNNKNAD